jgi:hypothetical protein
MEFSLAVFLLTLTTFFDVSKDSFFHEKTNVLGNKSSTPSVFFRLPLFVKLVTIVSHYSSVRRKTKNNLPNLVILFPLLYGKFFLNNPLFLKKYILIKENIITNLGTLFFVLRLSIIIKY